MRALAMTGMVTASWISRILSGSAIRATPPSRRMSAGTRSSAITATAPASSAIRACSAVVTSMITPPFSISARPLLTRIVPSSRIGSDSIESPDRLPQAAEDAVELVARRRHRPPQHRVLLRQHHVVEVRTELPRGEPTVPALYVRGLAVVAAEADHDRVALFPRDDRPLRRRRLDRSEMRRVADPVAELLQARRRRLDGVVVVDGVATAGRQDDGRDERRRPAPHSGDCSESAGTASRAAVAAWVAAARARRTRSSPSAIERFTST